MVKYKERSNKIKDQIVDRYKPIKIILFGSCAAGCARKDSDIDLCVVIDYLDKRETLMDLMMNIDYERSVDFIIYKPEDWDRYKKDTTTFANLISRTGVEIYG
jgi:predicted nucleotidyltransferase